MRFVISTALLLAALAAPSFAQEPQFHTRVATEAAYRHLDHPLPKGGVLLGGGGTVSSTVTSTEPLFGA